MWISIGMYVQCWHRPDPTAVRRVDGDLTTTHGEESLTGFLTLQDRVIIFFCERTARVGICLTPSDSESVAPRTHHSSLKWSLEKRLPTTTPTKSLSLCARRSRGSRGLRKRSLQRRFTKSASPPQIQKHASCRVRTTSILSCRCSFLLLVRLYSKKENEKEKKRIFQFRWNVCMCGCLERCGIRRHRQEIPGFIFVLHIKRFQDWSLSSTSMHVFFSIEILLVLFSSLSSNGKKKQKLRLSQLALISSVSPVLEVSELTFISKVKENRCRVTNGARPVDCLQG